MSDRTGNATDIVATESSDGICGGRTRGGPEIAASSSGGMRGGPTPPRRRSRRRREVRLDAAAEGASLAKIAKTMGCSHAKSTKNSYSSYHNSIHEWFFENNSET